MAQPIRLIKRDAMKEYLKYYDEKTPKSKKMVTKAKEYIPGGVQHNLSFNYPIPIAIEKAEGAYLYDIDGNRYIDFLQSGGPTMLGSNYAPVKDKVVELINECGPSTGLFHEYEMKLAKLITGHYESVDRLRMLGSGTEADMAAIRIARVATKKKNIIKIGGAYHGWSDQLAYGMHIPGTGRFESHGIPQKATKSTQEVFPNDIGALKKRLRLNKLSGGTAAVIVEPIGPESGTRPVDFDHNKEIRELCDDYDALLIFDEVVTAYRLGLKGAQGYFDVEADLTTFGKVIAGGYPGAGAVGGSEDLMEYVAAGVGGGKKRAYVGGTLAATPLSAVAGYYAIKEIEKTNACIKAGKFGDRAVKGLQDQIERYDLPFVAYNHGSIVHLETVAPMFIKFPFTIPSYPKDYLNIPNLIKAIKNLKPIKKEIFDRKFAMEEYGAAFMAEGLITIAGSRLYTSLATDEEVIDDALGRFDNVFKKVEGAKK